MGKKKTTACHCCSGSGREQDDAEIGKRFAAIRKSNGMSLREAARRMGISHTYLSQLEQGHRRWSRRLIEKQTIKGGA